MTIDIDRDVPVHMQPLSYTFEIGPRLECDYLWTKSNWRDKKLVFRIRSVHIFSTVGRMFTDRFEVNFHTDPDVCHLDIEGGFRHGATTVAKLALIRGAAHVAMKRFVYRKGQAYVQWEKKESKRAESIRRREERRKAKNGDENY